MDQKQHESCEPDSLTRGEFMRDGAIAAAGLAVGIGPVDSKGAAAETAARKTRSYNPQMEYRRLAKTGLWVSAASRQDIQKDATST